MYNTKRLGDRLEALHLLYQSAVYKILFAYYRESCTARNWSEYSGNTRRTELF